jgi:hypothetical protein
MATVNLTVEEVINFSAARLNDVNKQVYTNAVQLPFVKIALAELQDIYESNNIPVTDTTSVIIPVDAAVPGFVEIPFDDTDTPDDPHLPNDLIEPKVVWESPRDLNQWTPMTRLDFLPQYQIGAQINQFVYYQWATNEIKMLAANADNDIKLDYIRDLFRSVTQATDDLLVQNSLVFLGNRTASLVSADIEENDSRANRLYSDAMMGLDKALTIPTKGRQRITTRRRPFRAGYKASRSTW